MIRVLTPAEMRDADAQAVAAVSVDTLMHNAGAAIAAYVRAHVAPGGRVVAFAGPGNNGGDARAAFAQLPEYDCVLHGPDAMPSNDDDARATLDGAALAIDGLFGTGSRARRAHDARARNRYSERC
jgi:NAD(P)H-hydrate repair Nnr-like enzyme with NAD(P)H-hydrate epimerase domain